MANRKDLMAGAILASFGLIFGANAILTLDVGSAGEMGPGYFPLLIAGALIMVGGALMFRSPLSQGSPIGSIAWRGLALISLALISFALFVQGLGLAPSIFLVALLSAFASRRTKPLLAFSLACVLMIFCTLVFSYGLGLPFALFGPWIRG